MKEKFLKFVEPMMPFFFAIIMFLTLAAMIGFLTGCKIQTAPAKADYTLDPCYAAADCLYRMKDAPDKSICGAEMQECRAWRRYEKCMNAEVRAKEHDFEKCWLLLNQK